MEEVKAALIDTTSPVTEVVKTIPENQEHQRKTFFSKQMVVFFLGGFILLCFIVLVGLAYASVNKTWMSFKKAVIDADITGMAAPIDQPGALPGSLFYQEKLLSESLFGQLLQTPNDKYLYTLFLTQERVGETHALLSKSFHTDLQGLLPSFSQKAFAQISLPPSKLQLTLSEMLSEVKKYVTKANDVQTRIQKSLRNAQEERDVVKILCLNDKLNQVDVSYRTLLERQAILTSAVAKDDRELASHEYRIGIILNDRIRQLLSDSYFCIGDEAAFIGSTQTQTTIDTSIPEASPSEEISPVDLRNLMPPATRSGNTNQISIDDSAIQASLQDFQKLQKKLQDLTPTITDTNLLAATAEVAGTQSFLLEIPFIDRSQNAMGDVYRASPTTVQDSLNQVIKTAEKIDPKIAAVIALNNVQNQQGQIIMIIPENTPQRDFVYLLDRIRQYNKQLQFDAAVISRNTKPEQEAQLRETQFLQSTIDFPLLVLQSSDLSRTNQDTANLILQTANATDVSVHRFSSSHVGSDVTPFATLAEKEFAAHELENVLVLQSSPSAELFKPLMYNLVKSEDDAQTLVSATEATNASTSDKFELVKNYHTLQEYRNTLANQFANQYTNSLGNSYPNIYANSYSNLYSNLYTNVYSNMYSNAYTNTPSNSAGNPGTAGNGAPTNSTSINGSGYNSSVYNGSGYNGSGYNGSGYNSTGYNGSGYNSSGYTTNTKTQPTTAPVQQVAPTSPQIQPTSPPQQQPAPTSAPDPASACSQCGGTWNGSTCLNPHC